MPENLGLSLNKKDGDSRGRGLLIALVVIVLAVSLVNLAILIIGRPGSGKSGAGLEQLALKLEKQQIHGAAARVWEEYMAGAELPARERASIWYRVGKLYQEKGDFESALGAYYRSESTASVKEIESEISLRVTECLEKLGRFAALRAELESRTSIDRSAEMSSEEIVAEIGNWKITKSDLEKMVESEIETQLSSVAGSLSPEQLKAQQEKMLDEVLAADQLPPLLERFVAEELVYREAMDKKLYEDRSYIDLVSDLERKILVQRYMEGEYSRLINITEEEVRAFYESNRDRFAEDGAVKEFGEVSAQAYQAVRAQKEMQIQAQMIDFLKDKYDVVIHRSSLGAGRTDRSADENR